jgi:hypothetical protein
MSSLVRLCRVVDHLEDHLKILIGAWPDHVTHRSLQDADIGRPATHRVQLRRLTNAPSGLERDGQAALSVVAERATATSFALPEIAQKSSMTLLSTTIVSKRNHQAEWDRKRRSKLLTGATDLRHGELVARVEVALEYSVRGWQNQGLFGRRDRSV